MYGEISLLDTTAFIKTKLLKHGFISLSDLLKSNSAQISKETKISEVQIEDLIKQAHIYENKIDSYLRDQRVINDRIVTLCKNIDKVLGNGIRLGGVHEIVGCPGMGKTQILMQICHTVQIPEELGGLNGCSLYIDTDGNFSQSRLRQITEGYASYFLKNWGIEINKRKTWENIDYVRVTSEQQLLLLLDNIAQYLKLNCKLIVIDSIGFLLKEMQTASNVQKAKIMTRIGLKMQELACSRKLAVVVANKITFHEGRGQKPQFGESWSSVLSSSLYLGIAENSSQRCATMIKGGLTEDLLTFDIHSDGLYDLD
ncbi:unnamed protein product [Blepharisma stoltei]|uniref:DNA repair protein RAD51 homolog 3 n=1 Tax=Blepharisma stoltei TaxID=1481888 RepID=A0AAU9J2Q2_9CILI|nr:unnamed protein product [Blepharisma stoltei]